MSIKFHRNVHRFIQLLSAAMVIAITWYVYNDYVSTTSAESMDGSSDPHQVKGVVDLVPTTKGIVVFPDNQQQPSDQTGQTQPTQ